MSYSSPLFSRLMKLALAAAAEVRVERVRFGSHTTAVVLSDGRLGLAMHFDRSPSGEGRDHAEALMAGRPARDIVSMLGSPVALESSVAVACINALEPGGPVRSAGPVQSGGSVRDSQSGRPGHFLDVMDLRPDDTLGMIGNFIPLLERLRPRVRHLLVFEQIEEEVDGILPASLEPDLLPTCSVVVISGTTLVNHTLDGLLDLCSGAREVVLAGPSTILFAEAYRGTPVTWLAGSRVHSPEEVLPRIAADFSFHDLRPFLHKILMPVGR
ncbi:DUF364 domain-containing protein [Myxococcota bacterium]|nr:DUF364 domain-containing protein [Myxococcota bacterium]